MITYLLYLTIAGTLGQELDGLDRPDLSSNIQIVLDAARYYLQEGAPSITKLFIVDNPNEIIRLEDELKIKILEDLENQLSEVWEEMNRTILEGYKIFKPLRNKAERLVIEIKEYDFKNNIESIQALERISLRVKELLRESKQILCVQSENGDLTGLTLPEKKLLNLTARLGHNYVKIHLLKMVYSYQLQNLMNVSDKVDKVEYKILEEVWAMASAWGKWSILDLMAFIKEPLKELHNEAEKYVRDVIHKVENLIDDTLDTILEIAAKTGNDKYSTELLKLFRMMSEISNPIYALCK